MYRKRYDTIRIKRAGHGKEQQSIASFVWFRRETRRIEKIKKRGKVKAGDKSILDIYVPILEFLKKNSDSKIHKGEINEILSLSLSKTKDMKAQVGRAKFLENRGLGCIDPGARSTEIILREFFDSVL